MQAGRLRHRIRFQRRQQAASTFGDQPAEWIDVLTGVPASITPLSGRRLVEAQARSADVTHSIGLRYVPQLANPVTAASLRIVHEPDDGPPRIFLISVVMNVQERSREIEILATEGANQG